MVPVSLMDRFVFSQWARYSIFCHCSGAGPRSCQVLPVWKPFSILRDVCFFMDVAWVFIRTWGQNQIKMGFVFCTQKILYTPCYEANWLGPLNNVERGKYCKINLQRQMQSDAASAPQATSYLSLTNGGKPASLQGLNALINMTRQYLPTLRLCSFQDMWYPVLAPGKEAGFTPFFQIKVTERRKERDSPPNPLLEALGIWRQHAHSVSSLFRRGIVPEGFQVFSGLAEGYS